MDGTKTTTSIAREETLLIIIDVQERLLPAMHEPDKVLENMVRLLALARNLGLPVIVTEQEKLGPTVARIRENAPAFEAVPKVTFNCFLTPTFTDKVRGTGKTALVIAGLEAHICVAQTALWAHPRFLVHVVSDAVASRSPDNLSVALERMRSKGITITSTEMVIYELLQQAGTPEFKAMLPYIK